MPDRGGEAGGHGFGSEVALADDAPPDAPLLDWLAGCFGRDPH